MTRAALAAAAVAVALLAALSMAVGSGDVSWRRLFDDPAAMDLLLISRWPRTAALILGGAAMAVSGLILQHLTRNRFVEPATAGTVSSAGLGLLVAGIVWPAAPVMAKMAAATLFALAGTGLFLLMIARLPLRSSLLVPLVGIMLGAVVGAATMFLAVRFEMLQSLVGWLAGDASAILRGRYEVLWLAGALTAAAYAVADRFAVAGLGRDVAVGLGLDYRTTLFLGLAMVAAVNGVVTVVIGALPFIGLIVPNLVSIMRGDTVRANIPWIALLGGGLVLACDIVGRLLRQPYEIPVGTVLGVVGAGLFLAVLLRERDHARA